MLTINFLIIIAKNYKTKNVNTYLNFGQVKIKTGT